jgi:hypothetical protein
MVEMVVYRQYRSKELNLVETELVVEEPEKRLGITPLIPFARPEATLLRIPARLPGPDDVFGFCFRVMLLVAARFSAFGC